MSLSTSPQTGAYQAVLAAPFGLIGVRTRDDQLCSVDFLPPGSAESMAPADPFSREVAAQFEQYLHEALGAPAGPIPCLFSRLAIGWWPSRVLVVFRVARAVGK